MDEKVEYQSVGSICNYYGALFIAEHNGKYYWIIENYDTDLESIKKWEEIPESLYLELLQFKNK
jgi:hypothetical protein